ncbi:MAG: 2-C-methyl-D-erythritol 2,4-cyclodiphosphate synthase [Acidimicrobiia bacterium]
MVRMTTRFVPRTGLGYDVHPFEHGRPLILAGIGIEYEFGLAGHSDGDAVLHALTDALLAASGEPDLGTRFPAGDDRYRGADSAALMAEVIAELGARGLQFGNASIVINAQSPQLAPHIDAMRARLSALLAPIDPGASPEGMARRIAIAPKRGEGVGSIGRNEAIAVWASVILLEPLP